MGGFHDYPSSEELERQTQKANKIRDRVSGLIWMGQGGDTPYTLNDDDLLGWLNPRVRVRINLRPREDGVMLPRVVIIGTLKESSDPGNSAVKLSYSLDFDRAGNLRDTSSGHIDSVASKEPHVQQEETFGSLQGLELKKWEEFEQAESDLGSRARTFPLTVQDLDMLDGLLEECYPFN